MTSCKLSKITAAMFFPYEIQACSWWCIVGYSRPCSCTECLHIMIEISCSLVLLEGQGFQSDKRWTAVFWKACTAYAQSHSMYIASMNSVGLTGFPQSHRWLGRRWCDRRLWSCYFEGWQPFSRCIWIDLNQHWHTPIVRICKLVYETRTNDKWMHKAIH